MVQMQSLDGSKYFGNSIRTIITAYGARQATITAIYGTETAAVNMVLVQILNSMDDYFVLPKEWAEAREIREKLKNDYAE
jgi:hypothetical protein